MLRIVVRFIKIFIPKSAHIFLQNSFLGLIWKTATGRQRALLIKVQHIKACQKIYNISTFIETGTYLGEMVWEVRKNFKKIYSIELDDFLFQTAKKRFAPFPNIQIIKGDSAKILPQILPNISEPCLFWLDAHYSGGITQKVEPETPIVQELRIIKNHPIKDHIILIDDANAFTGNHDYPVFEELSRLLKEINPEYSIKIQDNIIQVYPKR